MPLAKPCCAASAAILASVPGGNAGMNATPRLRFASGRAAITRAPAVTRNTLRAIGRCVSATIVLDSRPTVSNSSAKSALSTVVRPRWGLLGHSAPRPRIASSAGTRVTDTTRATSTASAIAGPNVRNSGDWATISAAVPAATVRPATVTIGPNVIAARLAASSRGRPVRSSALTPDTKKMT